MCHHRNVARSHRRSAALQRAAATGGVHVLSAARTAASSSRTGPPTRTVAAHIRRGHWRRQPVGVAAPNSHVEGIRCRHRRRQRAEICAGLSAPHPICHLSVVPSMKLTATAMSWPPTPPPGVPPAKPLLPQSPGRWRHRHCCRYFRSISLPLATSARRLVSQALSAAGVLRRRRKLSVS